MASADRLSLAGWNILPRNNFDINAFAPHHARLQPAICVVSHEAPVISRLELDSPNTTYIYRDSPPGRGTDDDVHLHVPPEAYVRYLHQKAPPRAALYLGNEPNDIYSAAQWSLEALKACDEVGRVGVFLNLSHGRPEPHHWAENRMLSQLVIKLSGTRHILGLHEYCGPGKLGEGYWIGRCKNVNARCETIGIEPPQIAITELGVLAFVDHIDKALLDSHKGWQAAGMSGVEMMAELALAYDIYAALPNVIGTALFCAGDWGEGVRADKDTEVKAGMETYVSTRPIPRPAQRPDEAVVGIITKVKSTKDASGANVRMSPLETSEIIGHVKAGDEVTVFPQTWRGPFGRYRWVWIDRPDNAPSGWVASVVTFDAPNANDKPTGPLPPIELPAPKPEPEPEPQPDPAPEPDDSAAQLETLFKEASELHTELAALNVRISGIYAAMQEREEVETIKTPEGA